MSVRGPVHLQSCIIGDGVYVLQRNAKLDAPLAVVANDDGVLPTDVLYDVLLRLQADVLCRFRLVCWSWRSLTSDPTFAEAHSSRHPLVVDRHCDDEVRLLDPFSGNVVKRIHMTQEGWFHRVLSMDVGLLCISETYPSEKACALNPATGAVTTLSIVTGYQNKSISWSVCVLGRVAATSEYKELRVRRYFYSRNRYAGEPEQTYQVTTLGGNGGGDVGCSVAMVSTKRAVVNGVVYFLLDLDDPAAELDDDVAAFDLGTEEWRRPTLRGPLNSHRIRPKDEEVVSFLLANVQWMDAW